MIDDEPQCLIVSPRRRGRPASPRPHSRITAWVPTDLHDRLIELASEREKSVSATIRDLLVIRIKQAASR